VRPDGSSTDLADGAPVAFATDVWPSVKYHSTGSFAASILRRAWVSGWSKVPAEYDHELMRRLRSCHDSGGT
jgi:hypothetical protein